MLDPPPPLILSCRFRIRVRFKIRVRFRVRVRFRDKVRMVFFRVINGGLQAEMFFILTILDISLIMAH